MKNDKITKATLAPSGRTETDARATAETVRRWMTQAEQLGARFSDHLGEETADGRALDSAIIYTAAAHVWQTSKGAPHWSRLEVDNLLSSVAALPEWQGAYGAVAVTLNAFYEFLVDDGALTQREADPVAQVLEPYARATMSELTTGSTHA